MCFRGVVIPRITLTTLRPLYGSFIISYLNYIPDYTHPYLQISTASCLVPYSLVSGLISLYKVDARKVPVETTVSAQLYVMTPDSLCCPGKDNRPQNQHKEGVGK